MLLFMLSVFVVDQNGITGGCGFVVGVVSEGVVG